MSELFKQQDALDSIFKLQKIFDDAAKSESVFYTSMSAEAATAGTISTGVLTMDLLFGGGHLPGRFTYFYGPTGSCKSTMLFHSIREAAKANTLVAMVDSEASTDPAYLRKLGVDIELLKGAKNKKGWDTKPQFLHHYPHNVEGAFAWMFKVLTRLPDKIMLEDPKEGMRYFLVDPEYKYNSSSWMSVTNGIKAKKIVEVEEATPQVFFLVDSLRMVTRATMEDLENQQPALLAKALHRGFSLVKSLLGKKMCNLIATNHLNLNPLDKYNKESEPGGEAVKFFPDVKVKLQVSKYKSNVITENHVSGDGYDRYSEGKAYIYKNKGGTSHREIDYRIWLDEQGEPGRGICPVYDMFQFLTCTQQLGVANEKDGTFKILVPGYESSPLDYPTFKKYVLTNPEAEKLKDDCHAQFKNGAAQDMYYTFLKTLNNEDAKKKKAKEKADILKKSVVRDDDDETSSSQSDEDDTVLSNTEVEL